MKVLDVWKFLAEHEARKRQAEDDLPRLNFACSPRERAELKRQIASVLAGVTQLQAEEILRGRDILPTPGSFQVMSSTRGYAIVFVVGPIFETHPVEIKQH